ncbi:MAG: TonB-dependent receptor [Bacteroidota bacterium]
MALRPLHVRALRLRALRVRALRLWTLALLLLPNTVQAQQGSRSSTASAAGSTSADTLRQLGAVVVTASPFALEPARAPLSLTVRARSEAERITSLGATLDGLGFGLPGVWISDRGNPSTGERLLVRGVGWRSAFGVRGSHVLLDGVPLTLADGQTPLTVIDAALVRSVEVLRGPASTFWGSGSGGTLALSTERAAEAHGAVPLVQARALGGAYGLFKAEASVQPALSRGRVSVWGSALSQEGYRSHAATEAFRLGASGRIPLGPSRSLGVVALGAYVPQAQAPGGLTPDQAADNPRQTRAASIEQDAGKALTQSYLALAYTHALSDASRLTATAWGGLRTLDNPIVPRYIQLDRGSAGGRLVMERTRIAGYPLAWGLGVEAEVQRDDRLETTNDGGRPGAEVLTDQIETVTTGAVFGRLALPLGRFARGSWTATAALRADFIAYEAQPSGSDDVPEDERQRTDEALSPSLGVTWTHASGLTAYANVAGAFDAPTTTELGNRADGRPGLNPSLAPERTWGTEAGLRRAWAVGRGFVAVDAAVFAARVSGLLVPRDINDVTVYENEGRAETLGLEASVQTKRLRVGPGRVDGAVAVTLLRATFLDRVDADVPAGARLPGVPPVLSTWTLTWTSAQALGLHAGFQA